MCLRNEKRRGEEVGSGPLLLLWRPHPDAAAAVGAGWTGEERVRPKQRRGGERRGERSPLYRHCHI